VKYPTYKPASNPPKKTMAVLIKGGIHILQRGIYLPEQGFFIIGEGGYDLIRQDWVEWWFPHPVIPNTPN